MIIGVPKEIKNNENRVALTPAGAAEFKNTGPYRLRSGKRRLKSGFSDQAYTDAGAELF